MSPEYRRLLQSREWRIFRAAVFKHYGDTCSCGARATDLHHKVYRRDLYDLRLEDVTPLCRKCHGDADERRKGIDIRGERDAARDYIAELREEVEQFRREARWWLAPGDLDWE